MDRSNVNPAAFALMAERNHETNPNQYVQHRDLNSELSEYEYIVKNLDRCCYLCIEKLGKSH